MTFFCYMYTHLNSTKFAQIQEAILSILSCLWLWDFWLLFTVLPDQIILRENIKIHNKIFIHLNEQLFPNCHLFGVDGVFYITDPKDLTVCDRLFIKKNEDLVINFDIPPENDLIRKYCEQSPEMSQSVRKCWGCQCVLTQFTAYEFSWTPLWFLNIKLPVL